VCLPKVNWINGIKLNANTTLTFIVEPVDAIEWSNFMVATEQEEVERILQFVAEQQEDCLKMGEWWKDLSSECSLQDCVALGPRSRQGTDSCWRVGSHRHGTTATNPATIITFCVTFPIYWQKTVHGCRQQSSTAHSTPASWAAWGTAPGWVGKLRGFHARSRQARAATVSTQANPI